MENGSFMMDVEIPAGSTASIAIPKMCDNYTINGKTFKVAGPMVEVESGKYSLSFKAD